MTFGEYLGLDTRRIDGGAEVRLDIKGQSLNSFGVVHGGVICSLVDHAIGAGVAFAIGRSRQAMTAELKVNFLAPATGGLLIAKSRILREGKRLVVAEAEVIDQDGRLIAKGLGTWAVVDNTER